MNDHLISDLLSIRHRLIEVEMRLDFAINEAAYVGDEEMTTTLRDIRAAVKQHSERIGKGIDRLDK